MRMRENGALTAVFDLRSRGNESDRAVIHRAGDVDGGVKLERAGVGTVVGANGVTGELSAYKLDRLFGGRDSKFVEVHKAAGRRVKHPGALVGVVVTLREQLCGSAARGRRAGAADIDMN